MTTQRFNGDKKVGKSILTKAEDAFRARIVPRFPKEIETYHLTMLTVLWSGLNLVFGYLAQSNIQWLWMICVMLGLQYFTDLMDGAIGRYRNTGLIKWGFYMDHLLDTLFLSSLVGAAYFVAPAGMGMWFLALLSLMGGFMVNAFLSFAATNEFEIYHYGFGPTEIRLLYIAMFGALTYFGTAHFAITIPLICVGCAGLLASLVYKTQRKLWDIDMAARHSLPA